MDKKSNIVLQRPKCTRCGKLVSIARTQSRQKDGLITAYCFNDSHKKLKIRIISRKNILRIIRSNRMKSTIQDDDYNLQKLKCVLCGHKLFFDKKGSYQSAGKIVGYCYNNRVHRLKIKIYSKLFGEPDFEELQEVIINESDR